MTYAGKENTEANDKFKDRDVIVDSGTSYFMMPRWELEIYLNSIQEIAGVTDCIIDVIPSCTCTYSQSESIPDIEFIIGN